MRSSAQVLMRISGCKQMNWKPDNPNLRKVSDVIGGLRPFRLIRAWRTCAGPPLLAQTRFLGVHQEAQGLGLRLEVPDPVWRQELEFQKEDILKAYREAL